MPASSASAQHRSLLPATNDTHICGTCKENFTDLNCFIAHKHHCGVGGPLNVSRNTESSLSGKILSSSSIPINSSPVFRVFLESGQLNQLTPNQETRLILQHLRAQGNPDSVILRSRLIGTNNGDVQADGAPESNSRSVQCPDVVSSQQNESKREFQMNDEDVAAILANQLANEVITPNPVSIKSTEALDTTITFSPAFVSPTQNYDTPLSHTEIVIGADISKDSVDSPGTLAAADIDVSLPLSRSRAGKQYNCNHDGCKFKSIYQKDLIRHKRTHTGEKPFVCPLCQKAFSRLDKMQLHRRIHDGIKPHRCQECSYSTIAGASLRKHMRIHNNERPFKCQLCDYRSRDSSQLTVHLRTHTGDVPFVCPYEPCTWKFKTSSDLTRHKRMHTGEKPFACDICDFRCTIKSNLRVHISQNHTNSKPVGCATCNHVATSKRAAKEHSKIHAAEVLKCGVCHFTCVSQTNMGNHMKVHTQPKPIKCSYCFYTCRHSANLRRHMSNKHSDLGAKSNLTKEGKGLKQVVYQTHQCTYCDASFVREDSWRVHIRQHKSRGSVPLAPDKRLAVTRPTVQEAELIQPDTMSYSETRKDDGEPAREHRQPVKPDRAESHQEQILSSSSLQAQPMYVYLHNDGVGEVSPIMFSSPCDQFVTVPAEQGTIMQQLAVSLQSGIQYVLSRPMERVESNGSMFVHSNQDAVINSQMSTTANSIEVSYHMKVDTPIMKKLGNQTL